MSERAPQQQPEPTRDETLSEEALESVAGGTKRQPIESPPFVIQPIDPIIEPVPYPVIETDSGTL